MAEDSSAMDRSFVVLACNEKSLLSISCPTVQLIVIILVVSGLLLAFCVNLSFRKPWYTFSCCLLPKIKRSWCYFLISFCSPKATEDSLLRIEAIDWESLEGNSNRFVKDFTRVNESTAMGRSRMIKFIQFKDHFYPTPYERLLHSLVDSSEQKGSEKSEKTKVDEVNVGVQILNVDRLPFSELLTLLVELERFEKFFNLLGPNDNSLLLTMVQTDSDVENQTFLSKLQLEPSIESDRLRKAKRNISFLVWFFLPMLIAFLLVIFFSIILGYDLEANSFSYFAIFIIMLGLIGVFFSFSFCFLAFRLKNGSERPAGNGKNRVDDLEIPHFVSSIEMAQMSMEYLRHFGCMSKRKLSSFNMSSRINSKTSKSLSKKDFNPDEEMVILRDLESDEKLLDVSSGLGSAPVAVEIPFNQATIDPPAKAQIEIFKQSSTNSERAIRKRVTLETLGATDETRQVSSGLNPVTIPNPKRESSIDLKAAMNLVTSDRSLRHRVTLESIGSKDGSKGRKLLRESSFQSLKSNPSVAESIASHLAFKSMLNQSKMESRFRKQQEEDFRSGRSFDSRDRNSFISLRNSQNQSLSRPPSKLQVDNENEVSGSQVAVELDCTFEEGDLSEYDEDSELPEVVAIEALPIDEDNFEFGENDIFVDRIDSGGYDEDSLYAWESIPGLPLHEEKVEEDVSVASSREFRRVLRKKHIDLSKLQKLPEDDE